MPNLDKSCGHQKKIPLQSAAWARELDEQGSDNQIRDARIDGHLLTAAVVSKVGVLAGAVAMALAVHRRDRPTHFLVLVGDQPPDAGVACSCLTCIGALRCTRSCGSWWHWAWRRGRGVALPIRRSPAQSALLQKARTTVRLDATPAATVRRRGFHAVPVPSWGRGRPWSWGWATTGRAAFLAIVCHQPLSSAVDLVAAGSTFIRLRVR